MTNENKTYVFITDGVMSVTDDWLEFKTNRGDVTTEYSELLDPAAEKIMLLNQDQIDFYEAHCDEDLSLEQLYNMTAKTTEELNAEIAETRRKLYVRQTDGYLVAYYKYHLLGDTESAEEAYKTWEEKVAQIKADHPYITEEES